MVSPTAELRMFCYDWLHIFKLKDKFSLIRFVGGAAAHHLRSTPTKAFPFFGRPTEG